MPTFRGTVRVGQEVATVEGAYQNTGGGGRPVGWRGWFTVLEGMLSVPTTGMLTLDNGRSARIIIDEIGKRVSFTGSGQPPF